MVGAVPVNVRFPPAELAALDEHRGDDTRPEAVRNIVRDRLLDGAK